MRNKWNYPVENIIDEFLSLREQMEKIEEECKKDLIQEKELKKKLDEIKQRREAFRLISVKFGDLKHIIENARPPKITHPSDPQFIKDREKTMTAIREWKDRKNYETDKT